MQKAILAASLAAVLGMGGAQAADLSGSKGSYAPAFAPVTSWTGFYIGAGGGLGMVNHDLKASADYEDYNIASAELSGIGGQGGFGTVQVGYDQQLDPHFVAGVFFDYDFANIESKASVSLFDGDYTGSISATLTDSWTAGGRLGYLVNANTLAYALAGYTQAHFDLPLGGGADFDGWTVGAGLETHLGGAWSLKGEYRLTSLNEKTLFSYADEGFSAKFTDQPDVQTGRLVLTYKLSGAGYDSLK